MYGRSNTSNSRTPSGPNLASDGASICTEPSCSASISSPSLNSELFGIDLDLDAALGALLGELLEVLGALALGRVDGDDVAELDDDRLLGHGDAGRRQHRRRGGDHNKTQLHAFLLV